MSVRLPQAFSSVICRVENGKEICERELDVLLRELKNNIIRELIDKIVEEVELELKIEERKALLKKKSII